jgi:hypothetical protein
MPISSAENYRKVEELVNNGDLSGEMRSRAKAELRAFKMQNPQLDVLPEGGIESVKEVLDAPRTAEVPDVPSLDSADPSLPTKFQVMDPGNQYVTEDYFDEFSPQRDQTASNLRHLYRPSEVHRVESLMAKPPTKEPLIGGPLGPTSGPLGGAVSAAVDAAGDIGQDIADAMPAQLGGNLKVFEEPPVELFRQEMGAVLKAKGIDPSKLDENSNQYKEFADRKWMVLHDQLQAEGVPAIRLRYQKPKTWYDKAIQVAGPEAFASMGAFSQGFLDTMTFGVGSEAIGAATGETENLRLTRNAPDVESENVAGAVAGAVSPLSPGTMLGKGIYSGLAKEGSHWLQKAAAGGVAAGTVVAGEGAAKDFAMTAADDLRGAEGEGADYITAEDYIPDAGAAGERFGLGALLGAPAQVLASGLGAANKAYRQRGVGREVAAGEPGGLTTDFIHGVKPPPVGKQASEMATKRLQDPTGTKAGEPHEIVAERRGVPSKLADAGVELEQRTTGKVKTQNEAYYNSPEGKVPVTPTSTAETLHRVLTERTSATGDDLPWWNNQAMLSKAKALWATASVKPKGNQTPGEIAISLDQADRMGVPYKQLGRFPRESQVAILKPAAIDARTLDSITEAIDIAAKAGKAKGAEDPVYEQLMKAIRQDRDQFKANKVAPRGFSAMKNDQAGELSGVEQTLGHAGNPRAVPRKQMTANEQKVNDSLVHKFKTGNDKEANEALMRLANAGKFRTELEEVSATEIGLRLREQLSIGNSARVATGSGGPSGYFGGAANALRVRIDPAMRAMAQELPQPVKELLISLRKTKTSFGLGVGLGPASALGGGALGRKVVTAKEAMDNEGDFVATDEDMQNLALLLSTKPNTFEAKIKPKDKTP